MRRLIDALQGLVGRRRSPPPQPTEPSPLDDLRDYIRLRVASGFADEDVILRDAVEVYEGELEADTLRTHAQRLLREALREHRIAQASWPLTTDCDRLDAAFASLESSGIVCRHDFTCCGSCGVAEIGAEIDDANIAGDFARGYAFYHAQDTEAAVDRGDLYLNYGSVEDDRAEDVAIGREIASALSNHGLAVTWDGDVSRRIAVALTWQRRR